MLSTLKRAPTEEYELPLARDYVSSWGLPEAARELLQNALDAGPGLDARFDQEDDGYWTLSLFTPGARLTPDTLLLGTTTKAQDHGTIGAFGEGYKLALLVLAREGYPVQVINGDEVWAPLLRWSDRFRAELLVVRIDHDATPPLSGVEFRVSGLSEEEVTEIRHNCLHLQSGVSVGRYYEAGPYGRVLLDQGNRLFVNGLLVCTTQLAYGYDVRPEHLELERDRQTVSTFDLQLLTKNMWLETERWGEIAGLLEAGAPDVEYIGFSAPELLKEACYQLFQERHPGGIVARNQRELDELVERGLTKVVVVERAFADVVERSDRYRQSVGRLVERPTPRRELELFLEQNKRYMRRQAIVAAKALIKKAESWRWA